MEIEESHSKDILSLQERSERMSRVRQEDTDLEIIVRKFLFSRGFRYRKNDKRYYGRPDIVMPKYRTVIFIQGCFWHGHQDCKAARLPRTRNEFWTKKISDNTSRDERNIHLLEKDGWKVILLWGCELKNKSKQFARLEKLVEEITSTFK